MGSRRRDYDRPSPPPPIMSFESFTKPLPCAATDVCALFKRDAIHPSPQTKTLSRPDLPPCSHADAAGPILKRPCSKARSQFVMQMLRSTASIRRGLLSPRGGFFGEGFLFFFFFFFFSPPQEVPSRTERTEETPSCFFSRKGEEFPSSSFFSLATISFRDESFPFFSAWTRPPRRTSPPSVA